MSEQYFNLKHKLEELGYNYILSLESVPLVECILADLLQTTKSLQHYMDLSKQALTERDSLIMEAEPYKCDNIKLIQENNQLYQNNILLKEEILKLNKESKRKLKALSEELSNKELLINKLQHDIRDFSLRGLCADTLSSRNRSKRKDGGDCSVPKICFCSEKTHQRDNNVSELKKNITSLQLQNEEFSDEIMLLHEKVENREKEIVRLKLLLEGGRPIKAVKKDFIEKTPDIKVQNMMKHIKELENTVDTLKKDLEVSLEKQHEAMLRALSLADKNKTLQEELEKVDRLALKVEDDCNKRLNTMTNEFDLLQAKLENLTLQNSDLKSQLAYQCSTERLSKKSQIEESLSNALKEKDSLQKEVKDLAQLNKSLHDKIISLADVINTFHYKFTNEIETYRDNSKCTLKDEFHKLIQDERNNYESYIKNMQEKLNETIIFFKMQLNNKNSPKLNSMSQNPYIKEIHNKLCESEQKILLLRKENDDLKSKMYNDEDLSHHKYQDIISHLNAENSELSKENISLSQQISHYKGLSLKSYDRCDSSNQKLQNLKDKINELTTQLELVQKDKMEYNLRYKEAMDLVDKLKKDLIRKQNEVEILQEENSSYKMTNRSEKASANHMKDECSFLKDQLKKIQHDMIKEKTIANQIRNIQHETERNNTEVQNEVLQLRKRLSLSMDNIESLEKKCKELQSEISSLKNDKSNLLDNMKSLDKERDKLVIDLDNKTENMNMLEEKYKMQTNKVDKLEREVSELHRKLTSNKIFEHKIVDCESQINFLNGEILRLTQQYDTAVIENKHLQNSLTDNNGILKLTKMELEKSRKDVDTLRQQLQHYVAEIRRIEELLSQKEAERSDMLDQFASLSVEANILENTNHSLESESASKSLQLQSYVSKIQTLEQNLSDKENIIDSQSAHLAALTCKLTSLENENKLLVEEKAILQQNITYLKQMCNNLQENQSHMTNSISDSANKSWEKKVKVLSHTKTTLETENDECKDKLKTLEKLLSNARKEIIELKLALQDATNETQTLQGVVNRFNTQDIEINKDFLSSAEIELPEISEERIEELNDDSIQSFEIGRNISLFKHSSTI